MGTMQNFQGWVFEAHIPAKDMRQLSQFSRRCGCTRLLVWRPQADFSSLVLILFYELFA